MKVLKKCIIKYKSEKNQRRSTGCSDWVNNQIKIHLEAVFSRGVAAKIKKEILREYKRANNILYNFI